VGDLKDWRGTPVLVGSRIVAAFRPEEGGTLGIVTEIDESRRGFFVRTPALPGLLFVTEDLLLDGALEVDFEPARYVTAEAFRLAGPGA
jgi:hypothetical protein